MTRRHDTELSEAAQADLHRARRAARWVGLIVPLVLASAATLLVALWIGRIPDPAATRWGFAGGPDGFGPSWTYLVLAGTLGFGLPALIWATVVGSSGEGAGRALPVWSSSQRFMAAFGAGAAAFAACLSVGLVWLQLDLADAADAPPAGWPIGLSFAAWVLIGLAGWLVQPAVTVVSGAHVPAAPLDLAATERAVWVGEAKPARWFLAVIGSVIAIGVAAAVAMFLFEEPLWILPGALALLFLVLLCTLSWFWVRIDRSGLEARSIVGWPVFRLAAEELASVDVADIRALAEFGGFGVRWAPGRFGIVLRSGDGIVATRVDGRIFAVTIDDAATAAAVLAAAGADANGGSDD